MISSPLGAKPRSPIHGHQEDNIKFHPPSSYSFSSSIESLKHIFNQFCAIFSFSKLNKSSCIGSFVDNVKMNKSIETELSNNVTMSRNSQDTIYVYQKGDTRKAVAILFVIFAISCISIYSVYYNFPKVTESEHQYIKLPRTISDAKQLGSVLLKYKDSYFFQVLGGVFITYIFLQTFAIPGSIFLSIMSGYLFPFSIALLLVCFCSATGASFCYLLSYLVCRKIVHKYIPDRVSSWAKDVQKHKDHLFNYILFLRITPFLPNWFINLASPIVEVPIGPFFWGTFLGVMPPSVFAIQGGQTLQKLSSATDTVTWKSGALLAVFALLSIAPVLLKKKLKEKLL